MLQEFVSIDGMAAGPNDTVDFIPASTQADSSFGREQSVLMDTVDTLLLGRVTYEMFAGYWPNVTEGAEAEKEFADQLVRYRWSTPDAGACRARSGVALGWTLSTSRTERRGPRDRHGTVPTHTE